RLADCLGNDAYCLSLGDQAAALAYYRKALAIAESLSAGDPEDVSVRRDLSAALLRTATVMDAPELADESLRLLLRSKALLEALRAAKPDSFPITIDLATAEEFLGHRYLTLHRRKDALAAYQRSL